MTIGTETASSGRMRTPWKWNRPRPPFEHLNLRRNPFGEIPLDERPALAIVDVKPLLKLLWPSPVAIQFIGEAGRGKTTHLLALRVHFPHAPYVHLPEDEPLPLIPRAPVLFIDETQRLSPWRRRRLFRQAEILVMGTHEDHSRELRRAGIRYHCFRVGGLSSERLSAIIRQRIEAARRGPGPVPTLGGSSGQALLACYKDDLRAIEHDLYELFQKIDGVGEITIV